TLHGSGLRGGKWDSEAAIAAYPQYHPIPTSSGPNPRSSPPISGRNRPDEGVSDQKRPQRRPPVPPIRAAHTTATSIDGLDRRGTNRHADQVRNIASLHLVHHMLAMDLDGLLTQTEFRGNLLVGHAVHDHLHHLSLTRRQGGDTVVDQLPALLGLAHLIPILERLLHLFQKFMIVERLLDEVVRASLHRANGHRHIRVTAHDDHWQPDPSLSKFPLQIETTHPRHADIQYRASDRVRGCNIKELGR